MFNRQKFSFIQKEYFFFYLLTTIFDIQVTVVGTRVLQGVRAVDADQPGPFSTVQYAVLPGPHSVIFSFPSIISYSFVLHRRNLNELL